MADDEAGGVVAGWAEGVMALKELQKKCICRGILSLKGT